MTQSIEVPIREVAEGALVLLACSGRVVRLLGLGPTGARVRPYCTAGTQVQFMRRDGVPVTFRSTVRGRSFTISAETPVRPLEGA